jgi:CheY-like chemotaxis protein
MVKSQLAEIPEQKTILVVEDEVALQEAIQLKLRKSNFHVLTAVTAEDALVVLQKERPDLIWLDLLMPGMGGFAFLERIRHEVGLSNIPVMVVSVSASPEKLRRAFELNVVEYIVKSQYKLEDIVDKVGSLLKI